MDEFLGLRKYILEVSKPNDLVDSYREAERRGAGKLHQFIRDAEDKQRQNIRLEPVDHHYDHKLKISILVSILSIVFALTIFTIPPCDVCCRNAPAHCYDLRQSD